MRMPSVVSWTALASLAEGAGLSHSSSESRVRTKHGLGIPEAPALGPEALAAGGGGPPCFPHHAKLPGPSSAARDQQASWAESGLQGAWGRGRGRPCRPTPLVIRARPGFLTGEVTKDSQGGRGAGRGGVGRAPAARRLSDSLTRSKPPRPGGLQ